MIAGGDFHVILDADLIGWKWKKTSSKRNLVEKSRTCVQLYFDLIDIWRLRNPVDGDKN